MSDGCDDGVTDWKERIRADFGFSDDDYRWRNCSWEVFYYVRYAEQFFPDSPRLAKHILELDADEIAARDLLETAIEVECPHVG